MEDERLGLPSASQMEIIANCPGSVAMLKLSNLPPEESSPEADRGTKIHAARETGLTLELTEDELADYNRGISRETLLLAQWMQDREIPEGITETHLEERLWLHWPETLQPACSARLDVHYVAEGHVLIVDWKAWRSPPSNKSWQLRVTAACAYREYDAKTVRVAFCKYAAFRDGKDYTDLTQKDLRRLEGGIFGAIKRSEMPDAQRNAGDWCFFCRARGFCPEGIAFTQLPEIKRPDPAEAVKFMPLPDVAAVYRKRYIVDRIFEAIRERFDGLTDEQLKEIGLKRTMGRKLDSVTDTTGARAFLQSQGFFADEIDACTSFGKEALINLIRAQKDLPKEEAERWLDRELDSFITRGRAKPSIVEIER